MHVHVYQIDHYILIKFDCMPNGIAFFKLYLSCIEVLVYYYFLSFDFKDDFFFSKKYSFDGLFIHYT